MNILEEIQAKCSPELISSQEHGEIARIVSIGRKRKNQREIGKGTILEVLGLAAGNQFLDLIDSTPDFRHVKGLIAEGRLIISSSLVQQTVQGMVGLNILTQEQADNLCNLGFDPDPVSVDQVVQALKGA